MELDEQVCRIATMFANREEDEDIRVECIAVAGEFNNVGSGEVYFRAQRLAEGWLRVQG